MKAIGGKGFLKVLAILLSLVILCLFLAECTEDARRERRMLRFFESARKAATEFSVPLPMILAVMEAESDFHPEAVSDAGASGLMQLMPDTFSFLRDERLCEDLPDTAIFDPAVNIRYGSCYLAYLYDRFGDWPTALAAYNAGEGRVQDWLEDPKLSPSGHLTAIPYPETAAYVDRVLSAHVAYSQKYPTHQE